jgi:hypothetical protein
MKIILQMICIALLANQANAQNLNGSETEKISLDKATSSIRDAFAKGTQHW